MHISILVNDPLTVECTQTTALLAMAALERGHRVTCFGVRDFVFSADGHCLANSYHLTPEHLTREGRLLFRRKDVTSDVYLDQCDVLLQRFNPVTIKSAVTMRLTDLSETVSTFTRFLESRGVLVVNSSEGLSKAANKLYLNYFSAHLRPRTIITQSSKVLIDFVRSSGGLPCILKPLKGSQGQDVFMIRPASCDNLHQIADVLTRRGYTIAQEFLPEATSGDVRLIVINGSLLESGGKYAVVQRVPGAEDFRSNVHSGGEAKAISASDAMLSLVNEVGPILAADGIFMAGLDFIGGKIVEINVYSIGGLYEAEQFTGVPFRYEVIARLEQRLALHKRS